MWEIFTFFSTTWGGGASSVTIWSSFRYHIFSANLYKPQSPAWYKYFRLHLQHVIMHLPKDCISAPLNVPNTIVQISSSFLSIIFVIIRETIFIKLLFWQVAWYNSFASKLVLTVAWGLQTAGNEIVTCNTKIQYKIVIVCSYVFNRREWWNELKEFWSLSNI